MLYMVHGKCFEIILNFLLMQKILLMRHYIVLLGQLLLDGLSMRVKIKPEVRVSVCCSFS